MEAALQRIQFDREKLELELAETWCSRDDGILYIDGSITGSALASSSQKVVGVIKTHRRLYAEGDALEVVLSLGRAERSSVIRISPRGRSEVLSWYLRLRATVGRDALWGLVRVEMCVIEAASVTARADEISRWLLAESSPLAAPDPRWDRMAYGIRSAEEFLRATTN